MLPHMDDIMDFAFFEKILPCDDYTQVLRSDSTEKPRRFFLVVQRCVTDSRNNNYDSFVKILKRVLPKGQSKQLLGKSGKTLREALSSLGVCDGMHKSFSEPTVYRSTSRPSFATSFSTNDSRRDHEDREESFNDVSEGGITFKCSASPEGINDGLATMAWGVASPVEESGNDNKGRSELAVRSTHQTVSPHRRRRNTVDDKSRTLLDAQGSTDGGRRAVSDVLFQLRNTRLECQQLRAQCDNHDKKVLELNDKLSAAIKQKEELASKTQRQNEEIESLRLKMNRKISELLRQLQASEQYKVMVSDLEVERNALRESQRELRAQFEAERQEFRRQVNAISIDFEQRIQQVESARSRLQERQRLCNVEITRLRNEIEEIKKVKPSFFCTLCCFALHVGYVAIVLLLFLALIFLYMWYSS